MRILTVTGLSFPQFSILKIVHPASKKYLQDSTKVKGENINVPQIHPSKVSTVILHQILLFLGKIKRWCEMEVLRFVEIEEVADLMAWIPRS